jgi:hypothetical protein
MDYLRTDWAAMSSNDWQGVILTVGAFVAMVVVYVMVFNPKNKDAFEAHRDAALRDEDDVYNNYGGKK